MNHNESTASARRIPVLMRHATTRVYTASLTFAGAEIQISKNGSAWTNAGGSVVEFGGSGMGAGAYYYQASAGDVDTLGWIEIKATKTGMDPYRYLVPVRIRSDGDIDQGDESADTRRLPIELRDDVTSDYDDGETFTGSEIQISVNGSAWANGLGTVSEIGDGSYFYEADPTEVASRGILTIKADKSGDAVWFYTADITPALVIGAPSIVVVSPTQSTTPGDPGGFSENFNEAKITPIIISVTDPNLMLVVVTFASESRRETAYRTENFEGTFVAGSFATEITNGFELSFLPDGGWPRADDPTLTSYVTMTVDAVDSGGNYTTAEFVWELPAAARSRTSPVVAVTGVDHVQAALGRIISQFRDAR